MYNGNHKIPKQDRPQLLVMFRNIVYAKNSELFSEAKEEFFDDEAVNRHPNFVNHVDNDLLPRYKEWAMCERIKKKLPTHGNNTTNYVETSFGLTKNKIIDRTKAFNLCDTLDIVLDNSELYSEKLIDLGRKQQTFSISRITV